MEPTTPATGRSWGTLHGVGVGPGDPELLTVKAVNLIRRIERVFVPRRAGGRSLARQVAGPYLDEARQTVVELDHAMGGPLAATEAAWAANAHQIAEYLTQGHDAVFLTEGDPLFYSTFLHIWAALRRIDPAIPVQIVPGVSSIFGAAAAAREPIAIGREQVTILPAPPDPAELRAALATSATVIVLKVGRALDRYLPVLAEYRATHRAVFVEKAGHPDEFVSRDLAHLAGRANDYFSLLMVRRKAED